MKNVKQVLVRFVIGVGLFFGIMAAQPASAQLSYRVGTVVDGAWEGYHVGAVDLAQIAPRLDFEQVTMTPFEFGELWLGFGVEWNVPRFRGWTAEFSVGLAIVNRVDQSVQPLKNWRPGLSLGIRF